MLFPLLLFALLYSAFLSVCVWRRDNFGDSWGYLGKLWIISSNILGMAGYFRVGGAGINTTTPVHFFIGESPDPLQLRDGTESCLAFLIYIHNHYWSAHVDTHILGTVDNESWITSETLFSLGTPYGVLQVNAWSAIFVIYITPGILRHIWVCNWGLRVVRCTK